jgi:hypothetical protein
LPGTSRSFGRFEEDGMAECGYYPQERLFERAPILGALLDEDLRIVIANEHFRRIFPDWRGRHCFELFLGRSEPCVPCHGRKTLADGRLRVVQMCLPLAAGAEARLVTRIGTVASVGAQARHIIWIGSADGDPEDLERD